jgi:hypothetical protein
MVTVRHSAHHDRRRDHQPDAEERDVISEFLVLVVLFVFFVNAPEAP